MYPSGWLVPGLDSIVFGIIYLLLMQVDQEGSWNARVMSWQWHRPRWSSELVRQSHRLAVYQVMGGRAVTEESVVERGEERGSQKDSRDRLSRLLFLLVHN